MPKLPPMIPPLRGKISLRGWPTKQPQTAIKPRGWPKVKSAKPKPTPKPER